MFVYLPKGEKKRHIRDHRHFLGEKRQCYINYGESVLDFFKEYLRVDTTDVPEEFIRQLQDENYSHCCKCGRLFIHDFNEENKIGYLSKSLSKTLGLILIPFDISSGLCNSCFEERQQKK